MVKPASRAISRGALLAILAAASVAGTSILGQIATYPNLAPWYEGLTKPTFNPPNWVFAPVWTSLFILIGFTLWRILVLSPGSRRRTHALSLVYVMLVLNAGWSWMFFGANSPLLGLINIIPQWLVIAWTIGVLAQLDRIAAAALLPLAAWVGFASVLNFEIWRLNG